MVASGLCTAWMNTILGLIFGAAGSPYTAPANVYVGLATAVAADGTVTGEPSAGNYARVKVVNSSTNWNTAANGAVDNKTAITFPQASASWGALDTFFIANHLTNSGAAVICYGTLSEEKTIGTNDTPSFAAGALNISFTATT
jgi:hypothetical protein